MPRALKACGGCGTPVQKTPCPDCRPKAKNRKTSAEEGLGYRWQKLRAQAIRRQPWCTMCGIEGDPKTGKTADPNNPLTGDHIIPRSQAPERVLDPTVVQVLCRRCNSRKGTTPGTIIT